MDVPGGCRIDRAEKVILLVDSSKFVSSSGTIVCGLEEMILITERSIEERDAAMIRDAGVELILATA